MTEPKRIKAEATLAGGKTWKQLHDDAKKAIGSGVEYWPKIVLELLQRHKELAARTAELSQGDLFSPPLPRATEERIMITEKGREALARSRDAT
jgi:hypothetical protein